MFPYISQWLWGSTAVQDVQQPRTDKLERDTGTEGFIVRSEEDWLLVDAGDGSTGKRRSISDCGTDSVLLPYSPPSTGKDVDQVAPSSSQESDAVSESAGSWVVAPPPCLTLEDSLSEMGSLENLLIEHPSMSVYRHSLSTHTQDEEEAGPSTQQAPPLPHNQVAARCSHHGRVRELMEVPVPRKVVKVPQVDGVPRLSRKALKRHNRHRTRREGGRGQRQWRTLQPQRR